MILNNPFFCSRSISQIDFDSIHVDEASLSCLVAEGCIGATTGVRTLLRFSTKIANIGDEDYSAGTPPTDKIDAGPWHWDSCHKHWHFQDYASVGHTRWHTH